MTTTTLPSTDKNGTVLEYKAQERERHALAAFSDARTKTRRAAQHHKRSLLRASVLADVALSAEEETSVAHTNLELTKAEQKRAEEAYDFAIACMRDQEMRTSSETVSSLQLCLRNIKAYGITLVQQVICAQESQISRSQTEAAGIPCKELEKEIAIAVMRFHDATGIGSTKESPEL